MLRTILAILIASTATAAVAQEGFKAADAKLNALYRQIEARLKDNSSTLHKLAMAQRAWIAFRDSECAFSSSLVEGGTVYPDVVATCRTGLTEQRVTDLSGYLNCEQGDMSCPVPGK